MHLDTNHRDAFYGAIQAVLASNLAEITMAQLVDGLPQADIAWRARGNHLTTAHPLAGHEQFCEGALEKTRSLRDDFDPDTLSFESRVSTRPSKTAQGGMNVKVVDQRRSYCKHIRILRWVPKSTICDLSRW